jgi:hypothetical protein
VTIGSPEVQTIQLSDPGTAAVTISGISIAGAQFTANGITTPYTLQPGQSVPLNLVFSPTAAAAATGTLTIASNAPTVTVNMTGTGVAPAPTGNSYIGGVDPSGNPLQVFSDYGDHYIIDIDGINPGGAAYSTTSGTSSVTLPALSADFYSEANSGVTGKARIGIYDLQGNLVMQSGLISITSTAYQWNSSTSFYDKNLNLIAQPVLAGGTRYHLMVAFDTNNGTINWMNGNDCNTTSLYFSGSYSSSLPSNFPTSYSGTNVCEVPAIRISLGPSGTQPPPPPPPAPHKVTLNWVAPAPGTDPAAGYNVYRAPSGSGSFTKLGSVSSLTSYTDQTVQSGLSYDYRVTAVDSSGLESGPSNITTATIPTP